MTSSLYIGLIATVWASGPTAPAPIDWKGYPATASVQPPSAGRPHPVVAHLVADHDAIAPGGTFRLGLLLVQEPGWHTYWRSPGDVGQQTQIRWELPSGYETSAYSYPVPERFETEGIVSYGYNDRILLFSEVKVPTGATPGTLDLSAHGSWLVCKENCIPGEASLKLPINVAASTVPSRFAPMFDAFQSRQPVEAASLEALSSEILADGSALKPNQTLRVAITVRPTGGHTLGDFTTAPIWPSFAPIVDSNVFINEAKVTRLADGSLQAVLSVEALEIDPLPQFSELGGLVQVQVDGTTIQTELTIKVPWVEGNGLVTPSTAPVWQSLDSAPSAASPTDSESATQTVAPAEAASNPASWLQMALFAFIGGLLLNIMPCVLPVLTLKLYGLIENSDLSKKERRGAGTAFTAGVLTSFWVLAGTVILLRSAIGGVGWGFQFQYPPYVAVLGAIVFAFALSMFGVFEVPAFGANRVSGSTQKEGLSGHFFGGVFATLLGTPCSAPFLGPAVGFAFSQSIPIIFVFFSLVGLGLAFPFLAIAWLPNLYRWLPKPGAWMETFKHLMGFSLIVTTVWLVDVLAAQLGTSAVTQYLGFLTTVALGCWTYGRWGGLAASSRQQLIAAIAGAAWIGGGAFLVLDLRGEASATTAVAAQTDHLDYTASIPWQPFSEAAVQQSIGKIVFIDFTAQWCLTCRVNEATVLETASVRKAMRDLGVVPLRADWTRRDPVITAWLERHGRAGVPFYLVIPKNPAARAIPLPEVLTPDLVRAALEQGNAT